MSSGQVSQRASFQAPAHISAIMLAWVLMLGLLYRHEAWGPEEVSSEPSVPTACTWGSAPFSVLGFGVW